ncbi:MAG TPA: NUDIX domain-containing protein [Candidatus Saccharimonadales bacterium]|nr:NUDIX domain-containing protein [Candidatus Saccharimonadales bacterium]
MHHIQKYILKELSINKTRRYSEMRPPRIDSNLYSYHLKNLIRDELIIKKDKTYYLAPKGLAYAERISMDKFETRLQPKVLTIFVVENEEGEILLWRKSKQPFVETWSLLSGKVHLEDESIAAAIKRELLEKFDSLHETLHVGDCYIRTYVENELVSCVLAHVCTLSISEVARLHSRTRWVKKSELPSLDLAPATIQLVQQVQVSQPFFFKEYDVRISNEEPNTYKTQ